jgi:hypothetical protein
VLTYDVAVRLHSPKALPAQWGLWKSCFCVPAPSQVGFFSKSLQCPKELLHCEPDTVINCDGVEPIVEDIRIVTLRKGRHLVAWLKFEDVSARNKFILKARPMIRRLDADEVPWARTSPKLRASFDDMFNGFVSPKYGKRNNDISITAYLSNLSYCKEVEGSNKEFTVDFRSGCSGTRCSVDGRLIHVTKGGQACLAGVEVGMKMVKINGEPFQSMLEMDLFGGIANWVDGKQVYQEASYQITYEKTTGPEITNAASSSMMQAFKVGFERIRSGMVQSAIVEKCSDCEDGGFMQGARGIYNGRSTSSTTCGGALSALQSYAMSSDSISAAAPLKFQLCSFGLSEAPSESFTVSDSSSDAGSFCARMHVTSNEASPTQSICEMYDENSSSAADLYAMYDQLGNLDQMRRIE